MKFNRADVKKGVVKIKVEGKPYMDGIPLDDDDIKKLKKYDEGFVKDFMTAANKEALEVLLADDQVEEVQTTVPYGVHTYGSLTVRNQREFTSRNVKEKTETVIPRMSIKIAHGVVGDKVVKGMSKDFAAALAEG